MQLASSSTFISTNIKVLTREFRQLENSKKSGTSEGCSSNNANNVILFDLTVKRSQGWKHPLEELVGLSDYETVKGIKKKLNSQFYGFLCPIKWR